MTAAQLIHQFQLQPHPEGGWFKETYRSPERIKCPGNRSNQFPNNRNFGTAIYFLLKGDDFSAFHRIRADEIWHFYAGDPLDIFLLSADNQLQTIRLGNQPEQSTFQFVVPADTWFAAAPVSPGDFSFVGCTVAPGFDFQDFELAQRTPLSQQFPMHAALIERLTRI